MIRGLGTFQWGVIKKPSKSNQTAVWPYHIFPDIWGKNDLRVWLWLWRLRKTQLAFASRLGCSGAPGETKPLTHLCQLFKERWKTKLGILFIWKILSPLFKERSRTKLGIVFAWMENWGLQVAVETKPAKLLCQFFKEWLELLPLNQYLSLHPLLINLDTNNIKLSNLSWRKRIRISKSFHFNAAHLNDYLKRNKSLSLYLFIFG